MIGYDETRLADALYWLAHDEKGRARLRSRILGVALAGGLISELLIPEKITLSQGRVLVCHPEPPQDQLSAWVYEEILNDQSQELLAWLVVLRRVAITQVVARLRRDHLLTAVPAHRLQRGSWGRARVATIATSRRVATVPWAVLSNRLQRREPMSASDAFVTAVALETGLGDLLLEGASRAARRHAAQVIASLPDVLAQVVIQIDQLARNDFQAHSPLLRKIRCPAISPPDLSSDSEEL